MTPEEQIIQRTQMVISDPWMFIKYATFTIDNTAPADQRIRRAPWKRPYIEYFVKEQWAKKRLNIIDKSRRMWVSWLMVALHLHEALTKPHSNVFIRCQFFDQADKFLEKMEQIYNLIPEDVWPQALRSPLVRKEGQISFPDIGSFVYAVASGASKMRSETASAILGDEFAFHEDCQEAFEAAKPTIQGGGRYTAVSTNPELKDFDRPFWFSIIDDTIDEDLLYAS